MRNLRYGLPSDGHSSGNAAVYATFPGARSCTIRVVADEATQKLKSMSRARRGRLRSGASLACQGLARLRLKGCAAATFFETCFERMSAWLAKAFRLHPAGFDATGPSSQMAST